MSDTETVRIERETGHEVTGELPPRQAMLRRARRHPGFLLGVGLLAALVLFAFIGPLVWPYDTYAQSLTNRLVPPVWHAKGSWVHPLGTDHLGRDLVARLIQGAQISLLIGFLATALSGVIGTAMGLSAGFFGGRVDAVISYFITIRLAMPTILVALAVVSIIGGSLTIMILVLGLLIWDRFAVVSRTAGRQIASNEYIAAAQAIGVPVWRILFSEILPNLAGHVIVIATLEMAHAILLESALSFLGIGVQPPMASLGLMVAEGKEHMFFRPWVVGIPGAALFLLVLAINYMGDGLRDIAAPESRA